jgi:hypothetical protein
MIFNIIQYGPKRDYFQRIQACLYAIYLYILNKNFQINDILMVNIWEDPIILQVIFGTANYFILFYKEFTNFQHFR